MKGGESYHEFLVRTKHELLKLNVPFVSNLRFFCQSFKSKFVANMSQEKRERMTLAEKKRYAEILVKTPKKSDAKKIINDLYRKKHDGEDIVKQTFSRLYDDRFKILVSKSNEIFMNIVENFLPLQIDETRPATPMEIEEVPQVQVTDNADAEKPSTSNWPKKQPKITSFFTSN